MSGLEAVAIIILIIAIIIVIYYFIKNNPEINSYFNNYIATPAREHNIYPTNFASQSKTQNGNDVSMGEKIKVKFKDIEMPNINTDGFSKKLDQFLNEKSEDLIKEWNLSTKEDIETLEKRFDKTSLKVDEIEKRFNEYREYTNDEIKSLDKRLKELEKE
ncbi:MAG: hypothetical protein LBM96_07250 [Methanobrevibacter sp.]|jgi:uncharacterized membrane protein|nr:hypothetical protein [Candidatus Methanoflexus mossambicus]